MHLFFFSYDFPHSLLKMWSVENLVLVFSYFLLLDSFQHWCWCLCEHHYLHLPCLHLFESVTKYL